MRKTFGLVAAVAAFGVVPGVAQATTFSGQCLNITGTTTFDQGLTMQTVTTNYHFTGTASCDGTINGKPLSGPVHLKVDGPGDLACSNGSGSNGQGSITVDATGQVIHFLMDFTAVGSEVQINVKGAVSGAGNGHASFLDPSNDVSKCSDAGGVKQLKFMAMAYIPDSTPIDDGQTASSQNTSQNTSNSQQSGDQSGSQQPGGSTDQSNSGSSTQQQPASKPKPKHKPKHKNHGKHKAKGHHKSKHKSHGKHKAKGHSKH